MKERLRFKKGIYTINFPFMLHDYSSWKEQVEEEILKLKNTYLVRKSAWWGYSITHNGAEIICYKN